MAKESEKSGLSADVKELTDLLRDYAKQETVEPLKGVGRYLAFGIAGAVMMSLAVVLLVLAFLRVLQSETTAFDGNWSWVPYVFAVIVLAIIIGIAGMAIARESGSTPGQSTPGQESS